MKNNAGPQQLRPLSEAESQLSANKWSTAKTLMFVGGVAAMSGGVLAMVYLPVIPQWLTFLFCVGGGLLIARARGLRIGT